MGIGESLPAGTWQAAPGRTVLTGFVLAVDQGCVDSGSLRKHFEAALNGLEVRPKDLHRILTHKSFADNNQNLVWTHCGPYSLVGTPSWPRTWATLTA